MSVAITSRIVSGVVVIDIAGKLCYLQVGLHAQISELLEEGHRGFVLNLVGVPYIDSFGLGQMVTIWTSVRNKGGHLVFLRPTDHVQKLFQLTRLNSIFEISGEEAQAVRSARTPFAVLA